MRATFTDTAPNSPDTVRFEMGDELMIAGHEPCGVVAELGSAVSKDDVVLLAKG